MPRIAIIGLSTLETIGMKALIEGQPVKDMDEVLFTAYSSFSNHLKGYESTDIFIVSVSVFALHTDFFIPRKNRTVVLYSEKRDLSSDENTNSSQAGPRSIYKDSSEEEIREILSDLMEEPSGKGEITGELSGREKEVLKELASGKTNKEIADRLSISVNTVITHRKNISSKLGIKSVSGLSLYALMNGVI